MSLLKKKPPVTPEERQEWLERFERGQSPPKIAAARGFDPRTVRKHLEVAQQEKEVKEARSGVLRNALERHYEDLCRFAERLGENVPDIRVSVDNMGADSNETSPYESEIAVGLRQHIPRSPIWGFLKQQAKLIASRTEATAGLGRKIESNIRSDSRLLTELTSAETGVIPGLIAALIAQAEYWVLGSSTLNVETNLKSKVAGDGFVDLSYGAYSMGKVREEHVPLVRKAIIRWTADIKDWEEFHSLEKMTKDLARVHKNLREEIAVIVLRRVVPGRCRYCPL